MQSRQKSAERPPSPLVEDGSEGRRDRVARKIEEAIISGNFAPGDRLDERALAEQFNVSRTPVREALNRLAATGLVEDRGRQGAFVAAISVADLLHSFEVMAELEGLSARLAADRMTEEERSELRAFAEKFEISKEAPPIDEYMRLNEAFHLLVYRGAHNPVLEELTLHLHRRIASYRRQSLAAKGRIKASAEEHRATAQAICAGDSAGAYAAMQNHVDIRRLDHAAFVAFIAKLNEEASGAVRKVTKLHGSDRPGR